jgi:hypothetical protein
LKCIVERTSFHVMKPPAQTGKTESAILGWKDLFGPVGKSTEAARVEVVVFRKSGEPLLIVPRRKPAAALAVSLYPAQTRLARMARRLWVAMLRCGVVAGLDRDCLVLQREDPFIKFLEQLAGSSGLPLFALLAGNPRTPGRRFLVLVFSAGGEPAAVVKVGADGLAAELIEKEITFLDAIDTRAVGTPKIRHRFAQGARRAFALDFVPGNSPRRGQDQRLKAVLSSWLSQSPARPLADIPAWQRLAQCCAHDNVFARVARDLQGQLVRSAIFHGDFAPWNVKVSPANSSWTVLDWERGEINGPPAWDWFHFVIQAAILVEKQSGATLARTAQSMLGSAPFNAYAREAGLAGREPLWLLAYLLHCRDVLGQSPILPEIPELVSLLAQQWLSP